MDDEDEILQVCMFADAVEAMEGAFRTLGLEVVTWDNEVVKVSRHPRDEHWHVLIRGTVDGPYRVLRVYESGEELDPAYVGTHEEAVALGMEHIASLGVHDDG